MREVLAPNEYQIGPTETTIFLSGSAGAHDWRSEVTGPIKSKYPAAPVIFVNPLRLDWPEGDSVALKKQAEWELRALKEAKIVVCWMCDNTVAPLTLLELGLILDGSKKFFCGINPNYAIRNEVIDRLAYFRPNITIHDTVDALTNAVSNYIDSSMGDIDQFYVRRFNNQE